MDSEKETIEIDGAKGPKFFVEALPTADELSDLAIRTLSKELGSFKPTSSDEPGDAVPQRRFPRIEIEMTDESGGQDMMFIVSIAMGVSAVVVVKPQHFDRTDEGHESLFRQCVALLEFMANLPNQDGRRMGCFEVPPSTDESTKLWRKLRSRWLASEAS